MQLKTALYKNMHSRVSHFVANTGVMDKASFEVNLFPSYMHVNIDICYLTFYEFHLQILESIYFELARYWMEMKFQVKTKADALSGLYKFRSRDFKIESVMKVDISALGEYFPEDSFWQEYLADDDMKLMVNLSF